MQPSAIPCSSMEYMQFTVTEAYFAIKRRLKINFWIFRKTFASSLVIQPRYPDFWNKWSWSLCVTQTSLLACNSMYIIQFTELEAYLAITRQINITFSKNRQTFASKQDWPYPAMTFEINGHGASVWCNRLKYRVVEWNLCNWHYWKHVWP